MICADERQADQLARLHHAYFLADPLRLRKQVLRALMRQCDQRGDDMPRAVALELLLVIGTPAHPDRTGLLMFFDEGAQRIGGYRKQGRTIEVGLPDSD